MRKLQIAAVVAALLIGLPQLSPAQDNSSDTYRQLKLFSEVFERVRAEYSRWAGRELRLLLAAQWLRRCVRVAPVAGVDAVDHRATVTDEAEQRADAIHRPSIAMPRRSGATGLRE